MEFTLTTHMPATAQQVYSAWLSSDGHSAMTGGQAEISDQIGATFTAWDGYIEGKNIRLEPFHRILQSWRTSEFSLEEADSEIEIFLAERDGGTDLTLIHTKLPSHGEQYIKGWEDHYFEPMKAYFAA